MGKTALAENIARNAAKAGSAVCFYSLEMSWEQLTARTLAGEARVAADWSRRPANFNLYVDRLVEAQRRLDPQQFWTDDETALSVAAMHARARRLKRQHGLGLIVTDYLQLASAPRPGRREMNRVQEVSEITNALKRMAKDLHVPVLALSQLSRQVEGRSDKRPLLSDLRESGSIEQDADVVMFLYRAEYYEPDNEDVRGKAEVIVAKNRHGATTSLELYFDNSTTQFSNLARPGLPLVHFNDTCCGSVAELRSIILKARRLAADHAEQERAAAAVKIWLLAQIDKKRPAPPTDPMETAPDQPFAPERLAA